MHIFSPESLAITCSTSLESGPVRSLSFAPSGHHLAAGCETGSVHILVPDSGTIIHSIPLDSGYVLALAYEANCQWPSTAQYSSNVEKTSNPNKGRNDLKTSVDLAESVEQVLATGKQERMAYARLWFHT